MGTMNTSLPDTLREFAHGQVARGGRGSSSEHARELIRCGKDRLRLQPLLLEGAHSPPSGEADPQYLRTLRARGAAHKPAKRRA